jgi:hypothetical protein
LDLHYTLSDPESLATELDFIQPGKILGDILASLSTFLINSSDFNPRPQYFHLRTAAFEQEGIFFIAPSLWLVQATMTFHYIGT